MLWHAVRAVCMPPVESVFVVLARGDREFARTNGTASARASNRFIVAARRGAIRCTTRLSLPWVCWKPTIGCWCTTPPGLACRAAMWRSFARSRRRRGGRHSGAAHRRDVEASGGWKGPWHRGPRAALACADAAAISRGPSPARAGRAKTAPTDEASAVEQMGLKPRVVNGSRENLKVTWPEDLAIAEGILERRK